MSRSALKVRDFRIFMAGHLVSLHGLWIHRVAQGWLAWELSHSEFWIGIVAFAQFIPMVFFGPLFGVLADRVDRKTAAIVVNVLAMSSALLLAALTFTGSIDIRLLVALAFVQGVVQAAYTPVRLAMVPNLVPPERLASAVAINAVAFNTSQFVGPALAGIIIATMGVGSAFALNGLSYIASIVSLIYIDFHSSAHGGGDHPSLLKEFVSGIRYTWNHEASRTFLALAAVMAFFGRGTLELLPAIAEVMFDRGSDGLAALTASVGAGAIIASVYLSRGRLQHFRRIAAAGVLGASVLIIALSRTTDFVVGLVLVAAIGMALSFSGVSLQTLVQSSLDDRYRGRVMSLWGVVVFGGLAIGGLSIGALARITSLGTATFATGSLGLLVSTMLVYYIFASGKTRPVRVSKPPVSDTEEPLL